MIVTRVESFCKNVTQVTIVLNVTRVTLSLPQKSVPQNTKLRIHVNFHKSYAFGDLEKIYHSGLLPRSYALCRVRGYSHPDNCHLGQWHSDNRHPGQLQPDNHHPGQLPTRTKVFHS